MDTEILKNLVKNWWGIIPAVWAIVSTYFLFSEKKFAELKEVEKKIKLIEIEIEKQGQMITDGFSSTPISEMSEANIEANTRTKSLFAETEELEARRKILNFYKKINPFKKLYS